MFSLRNMNSDDAALALVDGFADSSALFRHEIAYVLGQMQRSVTVEGLSKVLRNKDEHRMVRHEAAEAMGAIGGAEVEAVLNEYSEDGEEVVEVVRLPTLCWGQSTMIRTLVKCSLSPLGCGDECLRLRLALTLDPSSHNPLQELPLQRAGLSSAAVIGPYPNSKGSFAENLLLFKTQLVDIPICDTVKVSCMQMPVPRLRFVFVCARVRCQILLLIGPTPRKRLPTLP
jgi:hypothetical protein